MVNPLFDAKNSITSEQAALKQGRTGVFAAERRKINRQLVHLTIQEKALQAFEKYFPKMFHEPPVCEKYDENWPRFLDGLGAAFKNEDRYRKGLIFVLKIIQKGNENSMWQLDLPTIPLEISRDKLPYDDQWFRKSQACADFYHRWISCIEKEGRINYSAETLLADLLLSAVFHSGIHTTKALHLFAQAVSNQAMLFSNDQQIWFETTDSDRVTNYIDDQGNRHTQSRAFLAFPTMGLIYRWYRNRDHSFTIPDELETFEHWFNRHVNAISATKMTVKQLCIYSQLCVQLHSGVFYPQVLSHVASGKLTSVGVSHAHWYELHQPYIPSNVTGEELKRTQRSEEKRGHKNSKYQIDRHSLFLSKLRIAIQEKISATHKNTRGNAIKALSALKNELALTDTENILFGWLLHCISVNKNQPSTLRTYLSRGGLQWLNCCYGENIYSWTGDDFVTRYRKLLDIDQFSSKHVTDEVEPETKGSKQTDNLQYLSARLESLHKYAVRYHGLEPLSESLLEHTKAQKHIRAGYISEPLFRYMRHIIKCSLSLTDREKRRLECLAIIAFRTGLRIGELLKLRISDLEASDEMWLYVRDTELDDSKSKNAYRKIPLAVLLTDEELTAVRDYYIFRSISHTKSIAALMFPSEAGELIPLSEGEIQFPIQAALNACSKQLWTFHHLRHTAISRLQLLLHRDVLELHSGSKALGQHLMPWDETRCELIYKTIMSGHPRGDYWALAQFAGHLSPETTIRSYLHFSDWVSAACIRQAEFDWEPKVKHYFSGLSVSQLQQLGWNSASLSFTRCFNEIKSRLERYTEQIHCSEQTLPPLIKTKPPKLDLFAILNILSTLSRKEDIRTLQAHYQIEDNVIQQWLMKIEALLLLKTTKSHRRLSNDDRMNALLPGEMRSHAEQKEFVQITEKARRIYRANRKELENWIQYHLTHSNSRNHPLPFRDPNQLKAFIATSVKLLPANRIEIEVRCSEMNKKQWTSGLPANINIKHISSGNAFSTSLRIKHPDEDDILKRQSKRQSVVQKFNQYSTPVFHYLAYTVALTLFPVDLLRSWSEGDSSTSGI